jgi:membrane protease YdiL (CAAX protease family)
MYEDSRTVISEEASEGDLESDRDASAGRAAHWTLAALSLATPLLIPMESYPAGAAVFLCGVILLTRVPEQLRLRLSILFGAVLLLAIAPVNTERSNEHFLVLGSFFAVVVFVPTILLRHQPGAIEWRFWPRQFQWLDVFYVAISIPIAWGVLRWYFFVATPELAENWPMPDEFSQEARWRLFFGINAVGIWDELFFVNTVYGIMRSCFPKRVANVAQAVVYTAVLNDMAFTGVGPIVVYAFALTQGAMYERSRCLLYVLIVHLIVDAFLVFAILQYHYPDHTFPLF